MGTHLTRLTPASNSERAHSTNTNISKNFTVPSFKRADYGEAGGPQLTENVTV